MAIRFCALASVAFLTCGLAFGASDDFNRPNGPLGPDWTTQVGTWRIENNRARSSPGFSADLMTYNPSSGADVTVMADVFYVGAPRTTYVALVSGYANPTNNIFVKVQDSGATGVIDSVYFLYGNNGIPIPGITGGSAQQYVTGFTSARTWTVMFGNSITLYIDRNMDGTPEDVVTRGWSPGLSLGAGVGLGGFNNATFDNFVVTVDPGTVPMGPDWTIVAGTWGIEVESGRIRCGPSDGGSPYHLMTYNRYSMADATVMADVFYVGSPRTVYAALVSGYKDETNNVFVKVQDSAQTGVFDIAYFYYGNNGFPFNPVWHQYVTGFTSARIWTVMSGDSVTLYIDRNMDGTPEDVITRGGIPLANLGTGVGLGGYSYARFDNFVVPQLPGDMNCDGVVSFADINPFVLALNSQAGYEAAYPNCNYLNADANGDGTVDFADINPFIGLLTGP